MEVNFKERIKSEEYKCNTCGGRFKSVGKHPMCPCCQSESVVLLEK